MRPAAIVAWADAQRMGIEIGDIVSYEFGRLDRTYVGMGEVVGFHWHGSSWGAKDAGIPMLSVEVMALSGARSRKSPRRAFSPADLKVTRKAGAR